MRSSTGRRSFLKAGVVAAGTVPFANRFQALAAHNVPLFPTIDSGGTGLALLELPAGFWYVAMSFKGDSMTDAAGVPLANGAQVTTNHDGGAVFQNPATGNLHYVRNCEMSSSANAANSAAAQAFLLGGGDASVPVYDPSDPGAVSRNMGGTTTVVFNPGTSAHVHTYPSFAGTRRNCAGGPRGNSWFTCEEDLGAAAGSSTRAKDHGFVFEVDAFGVGNPAPITAMGRFNHEAVCFDPADGYAYLTEDNMTSGLYRFRPTTPGDFHGGGALEMLKIVDKPAYDTSFDDKTKGKPIRYSCEWVPIADPLGNIGAGGAFDTLGCYKQGLAQGGATFRRGEGIWFQGDKMYFTCTRGGNIQPPFAVGDYRYGWGQVWEFNPRNQRLTLIFTSQGTSQLVSPDNITLRPTGGASMIVCEDPAQSIVTAVDGSGNATATTGFNWPATLMRGLNPGGHIFDVCRNAVNVTGAVPGHPNYPLGDHRGTEWAGAAFSPDGEFLFASIFDPGITFAITGPWDSIGLE